MFGFGGDHAVSHAEHAQRVLGHVIVGRQDLLAFFLIHGADGVIHLLVAGAEFEHHIRGALYRDGVSFPGFLAVERRNVGRFGVLHLVHGDHALAVGVKGDLGRARVGAVKIWRQRTGFGCRDKDRTFGRVAHDAVAFGAAIFKFIQLCIIIDGAHPKRCTDAGQVVNIRSLAVHPKFTFRAVAAAGDLNRFAIHPHAGDGHGVLSQRASLVGADHGGGAEGFNRSQPADERVAFDHFAHTQCQADGHHRGQPFGHRGDCQTDSDQEGVNDLV